MSRDEHWMRLAVSTARDGGATPFGSVIVDASTDRECARGVNRAGADPTAHAEVEAIRALAAGHRPDAPLTLYTTAEPCPMCAAACFWAKIDRVVFGVSIPWLVEHGWRQIPVRAGELVAGAEPAPRIEGGVLADECERLFLAVRSRG